MTLLDLPPVTSPAFDDLASTSFADAGLADAGLADPGLADPYGARSLGPATDVPADTEPAGTTYARCADGNGTLTHLFFSDDEFDLARAKAICGKCGLASACLAGALDRAEVYGVWGGELLIDGQIVAVKRGRGRPPKTPRPPLVVDEVPLPPHVVA